MKAWLIATLLFCSSAFATPCNAEQQLQTFKSNYIVSSSGKPETCSGASACWLMDEASGSIVDFIGGVTLAQYNAANTYGVTGFTNFDPGITMNPTAGGFYKALGAANPSLSFGTGSGNIFLALRVNGTGYGDVFLTCVPETGNVGWAIRYQYTADAANSGVLLQLIATDSTTVTANWYGAEAGNAVFNGGFHTWEFRINRTTGVVTLLVDGISQGDVSIATLAGKSIDTTAASGIGLGNDFRPGINRNVPLTVSFVRVYKGATYP